MGSDFSQSSPALEFLKDSVSQDEIKRDLLQLEDP